MNEQPAERSDGKRSSDPEVALAMLDLGLARLRAKETARIGRRNLWLAHHWPDDYADRCVMLGSRPVCRRCASLYPLGFLVAFVAAAGAAPWPASIDPWPIWLLSLPATVAYVGEAVGLFRYHVKAQVAATLVTAVAFGRGLGYELVERWSPEFWGPVAVFGGIWYAATVYGASRRRRRAATAEPNGDDQSAATASTSSSSVLNQ